MTPALETPALETPALKTVDPPREATPRVKRRTLVAIGLLTIPILAAMLYGLVGRATSDDTQRGSSTAERSLLDDDAPKGSALGPAIALTVLGVVVVGCIAIPLVRARRRAPAAGRREAVGASTSRPGATTGADAGDRAGSRADPASASSGRTPRR